MRIDESFAQQLIFLNFFLLFVQNKEIFTSNIDEILSMINDRGIRLPAYAMTDISGDEAVKNRSRTPPIDGKLSLVQLNELLEER